MPHPVSLPPRPRHTFSLRTVERLHQQSTGAHVRPEQIPSYVESVCQHLGRVEAALQFRLESQPLVERGGPVLSKFERTRIGHILADAVLDIATISSASSNETYDAVINMRTSLSLITPRVDATPMLPCDTQDASLVERSLKSAAVVTAPIEPITQNPQESPARLNQEHQRELLEHDPSDKQPCEQENEHDEPQQQARAASPSMERALYVPESAYRAPVNRLVRINRGNDLHEKATITAVSHPLSFSESSISPRSLRFKPVLSMHSGADSSTAGPPPPPRPPPCRPRRYYGIDLQRVSEFTQCLRVVQRLRFTDSDFERVGLRYAIPGIRELDPGEGAFFARSRRDELQHCLEPREGYVLCDDIVFKRTISLTSTGGGTELEHHEEHAAVAANASSGRCEETVKESVGAGAEASVSLEWEQQSRSQPAQNLHATSQPQPYKDHCLPLFRGGKETIVQKKDLDIFLAMVETRLKQVDQEIGGQLRAAGADWPSSSGEEDTLHPA